MKILFSLLLISIYASGNDRCLPGLNKNTFAVPTIFKFLGHPELNFCEPLKIGQKRNFSVDRKDSPTTVPHKYQLERVGEKEYKIRFNITFVDGEKGKMDSTRSRAYSQVWRSIANECLAKVRDKIKGPTGETLTLEIEENNPKSKVPKIRVKLKETGRADSRAWIKDMPCSTVLHELLHVAGLVDEYDEKLEGYSVDPKTGRYKKVDENPEKLAYDCRIIGEKHSVMHSHQEKWSRVFGTWKSTTRLCECGNDAKKCDSYFEERQKKMAPYLKENAGGIVELPDELKRIPSECPDGFVLYPKYSKTNAITDEAKASLGFGEIGLDLPDELPKDFWMNKMVIQQITPMLESERESVVDEKQWNAMIFPGCFSKNALYYEAAENAYRTSVDHGGDGCVDYSPTKTTQETVKNR